MIGRLTGSVVVREGTYAIIDVGGIGYKVFASKETLVELGQKKDSPVSVWTYLAVREDALDLYGFIEKDSLRFFELLLSVSGIGPKSALAILNIAPVKTLESAIASGDPSHLTKTTGIGRKKAEKIILELKDKIEMLEGEIDAHREAEDVMEALQALGYSRRDAQEALKKIPKGTASTEVKIKEVLKLLGK